MHARTHTHTHNSVRMGALPRAMYVKRSDCILVYGSTTEGDVVKRSNCILVYGSTTEGDVVKRSDCILVYGSTTKGDVVKRSDCMLVYGSTTKGDVVKDSPISHSSSYYPYLQMILKMQSTSIQLDKWSHLYRPSLTLETT